MTISPLHDPEPLTPTPSIRQRAGESGAQTVSSTQDAEAVTVDTIPASPPPEVLSQLAAASSAADRLAAGDRALHFSIDRPGAGVSVQVTDLQGTVLGTVAPSTALAVAAGHTLD